MHPNFAGALLNSALYLICVFVAGLVTGHKFAWQSAVFAFALTYIAHVLQFTHAQTQEPNALAVGNLLVWLSIAQGAIAGLALLF